MARGSHALPLRSYPPTPPRRRRRMALAHLPTMLGPRLHYRRTPPKPMIHSEHVRFTVREQPAITRCHPHVAGQPEEGRCTN
jgi:hypothetical protein